MKSSIPKTAKKLGPFSKKNLSRTLFLIIIFAWPTWAFIWNFVVVNANSFVLAFSNYDAETHTFVPMLNFDNFSKVFNDLIHTTELKRTLINSIVYYVFTLAMIPIHLFVSFMVHKKCPGSKFFTVVFFLPGIISSIVWVMIFKYAVEYVIPRFFDLDLRVSLLLSQKWAFPTLLVYKFWISFAGGLIIYTGAMSRIPPEIVEYGSLDGLGKYKEFIYITLPLIFPTISVYLVTGVIGLFSGSPDILAFYGSDAPFQTWTFGYYFFKIIIGSGASAQSMYPYASAAGLIFTLICAPIVYLVRYLLEKFGPSVEF